ncbi:MAG: CBM35 domain-containing protein [Sedimentisphaerales bacterium]
MKRASWASGVAVITSFLGGILVLFLCFSSDVLAAADGWASMNGGTTGGQGGPTVTVTDEPNLIKYASSTTPGPYIVQVSGTITITNTDGIRLSAKKTLRGIGENPTLIGNINFTNRDSNMVIERLNITNPHAGSAYDGISLKQDINNVFITKCTFYDCGDGELDITNRSNYVTVSWCKFYYTPSAPDPSHTFSSLVGASDSQTADRGKLKITYHHNWWTTGCKERMPRVRFGQVHVYNNYYSDLTAGGYCVGVGVESNIRVENNYFNSVPNPWADYYTGNGAAGAIGWNTGNVFYNCTIPTWADNNYATIFTPPYSYTLDNAQDIPIIVQYGAGADGNDTTPPHWLYTFYGDFDRSGIVDMNDLPQFVGYWLDTNGIADADYYADGIVNFREFTLLASNWRYIPPDTTAPAAPNGLWALGSNGTVPLDWDDNNEPDFAGYNIYRSITSGSGYSKLNVSLLSNSNYTDNSVVNGTMYYYVVTAADTSSNESGHSVEACAVPDSNTNIILQENATGFCGVDGPVESEWAGFTGAGYANTDNALGNGINWRISVPSDGNYTFVWRYALVSGDRTGKLIVNGVTLVPSISFPASGALTTYIETTPIDVALTAGINDLRLEATTADGLGNIDNLKITGINPQAAGCQ